MKVAVFSTKTYDREYLESLNSKHGHELFFYEAHLDPTTISLADGFPVVCVFVDDNLSAGVLAALARQGTRLIALRSAGFNNLDLPAAHQLGMTVVRCPGLFNPTP